MKLRAKHTLNPGSPLVYDVILSPLVTEKATDLTQYGQYAFKVAQQASKADVKVAIEKLYKVKVESVNTMIVKGKTTRFKGRPGKRSDVKKAIVRLAKGQSIDLSGGL